MEVARTQLTREGVSQFLELGCPGNRSVRLEAKLDPRAQTVLQTGTVTGGNLNLN